MITHTTIKDMNQGELTQRLTSTLQQAYLRRSRTLPSNLSDIVKTLKGDLLKAFPDVPFGKVDDAIISATLNEVETPLSAAFFFSAVKKAWYSPRTNNHQWDGKDQNLLYWRDRLAFLDSRHLSDSPMADECRWWIDKIKTGDTEQDTIELLDLVAQNIAAGLKAYFDPMREYNYLRLRNQIPVDAATDLLGKARDQINVERVKNHQRPLADWTGVNLNELNNRARHLAVVAWITSCNTAGLKPSDILTPLMDETSYRELRKTC